MGCGVGRDGVGGGRGVGCEVGGGDAGGGAGVEGSGSSVIQRATSMTVDVSTSPEVVV